MNINFTDPRMVMCQQEYNKLDPEERITMSHFDLAQHTAIDQIEPWIDFLKDPRVADSINEELTIYKEAQQRKLISRATTHDKSVGTAQMINALGKSMEEGKSLFHIHVYDKQRGFDRFMAYSQYYHHSKR